MRYVPFGVSGIFETTGKYGIHDRLVFNDTVSMISEDFGAAGLGRRQFAPAGAYSAQETAGADKKGTRGTMRDESAAALCVRGLQVRRRPKTPRTGSTSVRPVRGVEKVPHLQPFHAKKDYFCM